LKSAFKEDSKDGANGKKKKDVDRGGDGPEKIAQQGKKKKENAWDDGEGKESMTKDKKKKENEVNALSGDAGKKKKKRQLSTVGGGEVRQDRGRGDGGHGKRWTTGGRDQ